MASNLEWSTTWRISAIRSAVRHAVEAPRGIILLLLLLLLLPLRLLWLLLLSGCSRPSRARQARRCCPIRPTRWSRSCRSAVRVGRKYNQSVIHDHFYFNFLVASTKCSTFSSSAFSGSEQTSAPPTHQQQQVVANVEDLSEFGIRELKSSVIATYARTYAHRCAGQRARRPSRRRGDAQRR